MCRGGDCVEYPVLYQGEQAGQVTLTARGGQVQAVVSCRRDNTGLFRAYLLCEKGEYPLGVLEPRGEHMGLRRTVRAGELQALGTVWRGEMRMSYAFSRSDGWEALEAGTGFFQKDPWLSRQAAGLSGALWRREGGLRLLAIPWSPDHPFPLPALFCFARTQVIRGSACVVYRFDEEERPVFH